MNATVCRMINISTLVWKGSSVERRVVCGQQGYARCACCHPILYFIKENWGKVLNTMNTKNLVMPRDKTKTLIEVKKDTVKRMGKAKFGKKDCFGLSWDQIINKGLTALGVEE